MWEYLQPKLKPFLHVERLTDRFNDGIPDTLWTLKPVDQQGNHKFHTDGQPLTGLLELKWLKALPKDLSTTPVLTYGGHGLQPAQAFWLNRWARNGGRCGILLRVGTEDWYYWRADGRPEWLKFIVSTDAINRPTRQWGQGANWFATLDFVRALCAS
jgi:hypothetical protein